VDFTRQPIIETVITAKEGCKLVIRSSKSAGQEEYFVDAIEVVSFGNTFFFRSQEKPKSFLVPATDYEVLEVREARMVLKNVGMNRSIKIGGGKEKPQKELEKPVEKQQKEEEQPSNRQTERKRDRRRSFRRRKRGDEDSDQGEQTLSDVTLIPPPPMANKPIKLPEPKGGKISPDAASDLELSKVVLNSLLPPPPNLISDTIEKYKDNKLFEGVFVGSSRSANKPAEETIESVEEAIEEEGCCAQNLESSCEFSEEKEQQIVEQRQKFEESEDPLVTDSFSEEPFTESVELPLNVSEETVVENVVADEEAPADTQSDEVSSPNN
jgi:hypothetical protein